MAIYTKTGDKGTTGLFDGLRGSKDSERVQAYGTLDELNAQLSVCEKLVSYERSREMLRHLQGLLFRLCAEVATADLDKVRAYSTLVEESDIKGLEQLIDEYTQLLPPLRSFIYQGNNLAAAELHVARTICRRAERCLIVLRRGEPVRPIALAFVNRLSDCIYTLARMEDQIHFVEEVVQRVVHKLSEADVMAVSKESEQPNMTDIDTEDALRQMAWYLVERAVEKSKEIGVPVVIAIADTHGNPVVLYRMSEALLVSTELAQSKAYTAVAMKCKTADLSTAVLPGSPLYQIEAMVEKRIVTFGGGFPIKLNGRLVGGLGISGGTVAEDVAIGTYALAYMEDCDGK